MRNLIFVLLFIPLLTPLFTQVGSLLSIQSALAEVSPTTAILVDKKSNTLHICEYVDGSYKIIKTFHATLGQVTGDKEDENDLKTPEGIYTFKSRMTPPLTSAQVWSDGILHELSECL